MIKKEVICRWRSISTANSDNLSSRFDSTPYLLVNEHILLQRVVKYIKKVYVWSYTTINCVIWYDPIFDIKVLTFENYWFFIFEWKLFNMNYQNWFGCHSYTETRNKINFEPKSRNEFRLLPPSYRLSFSLKISI